MTRLFLVLALGFSLISCKKEEVEIDPQLVNLYVEIKLINQTFGQNSMKAKIKRMEITEQFGIRELEFQSKIKDLKDNEETWKSFQDDVIKKLEVLEKKVIKDNK